MYYKTKLYNNPKIPRSMFAKEIQWFDKSACCELEILSKQRGG